MQNEKLSLCPPNTSKVLSLTPAAAAVSKSKPPKFLKHETGPCESSIIITGDKCSGLFLLPSLASVTAAHPSEFLLATSNISPSNGLLYSIS